MPADLVAYVGTYTRSSAPSAIHAFRVHPATGALRHLHSVPEYNPSFLTLDPRGQYLFAVSEGSGLEGGAVASFKRDPSSDALTPLNRQSTLGGEPCHLCTDASGHWLFVANHEHGSVAVLPIGSDGYLAPASDLRQHAGSGPGPTRRWPHAHCVTFDPAGERLIVADKGIDQVVVYLLDRVHGKLAPNDPPFGALHPGAAPRHLAFHPNGRFLYVNGEADMTITAFSYHQQSGALHALQSLSTVPEGAHGDSFSTAEVTVHPSGRFVYVSNRGHDSIAISAVDPGTGHLRVVTHVPTLGRTPRHFTIDPSATWLYVANQDSDTIVQFKIDSRTGNLSPTGHVTPVVAPTCILFGQSSAAV